ncbi:ABC transporter permease [Spiroplasma endosymbiont of Othius punctulatus]|uniref:ABC transporter permease n=1 Tax=Spiroplasma endosymbiont of Othius punctulatus TaxID=3066289 RepID=UPI0030D50AF1
MRPNIFLLLKQGIKGVFKFKIQFVIIVILSFLASLVLTLSISVDSRISSDHKKTMNKLGDVDYVWNYKVGANASDSRMSSIVPVFDFVNNQYVEAYDGSGEEVLIKNVISEYNVNTSGFEGEGFEGIKGFDETFITKSFESKEFNKAFTKLKTKDTLALKSELIRVSTLSFTSGDYKNNSFAYISELYNVLREQININFVEDYFDNVKEYALESTVFKFITENKIEQTEIDLNNKNQTPSTEATMLNNYIDVMTASLLSEVLVWTNKALDYGMTLSGEIYEFIFGIKATANTSKNNNFVVAEDPWTWEQKIDISNKGILETFAEEEKDQFILQDEMWQEQLKTYGLRGALSFVAISSNSTGAKLNVSVVNEPTRLKMYEMVDGTSLRQAGLTESIFNSSGIRNTSQNFGIYSEHSGNLDWKNNKEKGYQRQIENVFVLRQQILAKSFGFEYAPRIEQEFKDQISDINFRMVSLTDNWLDKVTLYSGLMPKASNEILISSGFANSNGINVGQRIDIGGGHFVISGIASDALTYYPIASLDVPLPNNRKSAIVYGKPDTLSRTGDNDYGSMIDTRLFGLYNWTGEGNKEEQINKLKLSMFAGALTIRQNHDALAGNTKKEKFVWSYDIVDRESSVFNLNWTMTPLLMMIYEIVALSLALLILVITIITMVIAIKKTIELNAKELGILKALGVSSSQLAYSYISYSLIVMFITVPLGWILASFLQEFMSILFLNYSSGSRWLFVFDPKAIALGVLAFGVLTLVISYLTAYFICKKPVNKILTMNASKETKSNKFIDWINGTFFKKFGFGVRFSIGLASSGFKKSLIILTTVFFSGLFISTLIAIPATATGVSDKYFEYTNYKNEFKSTKPIYNAPLGKISASATLGVDEYDDFLVDANGKFGDKIDNFYTSNTTAGAQVESSVVPHVYLNDNNNREFNAGWVYDVLANGLPGNTEQVPLLSPLLSVAANNLAETGGKLFSIVDFQRILEWTLHKKPNNYEILSDAFEDKKQKINEVTSLLNGVVPRILTMLVPDAAAAGGDSWKEQIISVLLGTAPNFIKGYVNKSDNRVNQFGFGWSTWSYVPGKDTFVTRVSANSDRGNVNFIGLPTDQSAFEIGDDNAFQVDDINYQKLENMIFSSNLNENEKDIVLNNGHKLYDSATKTLDIPASFNHQANITYKKGELNNLSTEIQAWTLDNENIVVPQQAWLYDDTNFQRDFNKDVLNERFVQQSKDNSKYWLPVDMLNKSKLTYAPIWNEDDSLAANAFGFGEFYQTKTENEFEWNTRMRPYYSYDDIYLVLPEKFAKEHLDIAYNSAAPNDPKNWTKDLTSEELPIATVNAWKNAGLSDAEVKNFVGFKPYSLKYNKGYVPPKTNFVDGQLDQLTSGYVNWYIALQHSKNPMVMKLANQEFKYDKFLTNTFGTSAIENVNVTKTDTLNTYGENTIIIDQRLANIISGQINSYYVPYNYEVDDLSTATPLMNGTIDTGVKMYEQVSAIDNLNRPLEQQTLMVDGQYAKPVNRSFTGLLSNIEEPQTITTQVSFGEYTKYGSKTIGGAEMSGSNLDGLDMVLLSEMRALMSTTSIVIASITAIMIAAVIIVSTLSTILVSDLFVQQYKRFMVVMKSMGYTNWQIISYTMGPTFIASFIMFCIAGFLGNFALYITVYLISTFGFAIPYAIIWWSPVAAFILVIGALIFSFWISTIEIRKTSPSKAMSVTE